MIDNRLLDLLDICGFSERERQVLSYLLGTSSSTASLIARRTGLKRPTVYSVLEALIDLGLVQRSKHENVATFSAASRELIPELIESRAKAHYTEVQSAAKDISNYLQELPHPITRDIAGFAISTLESAESVYLQLHGSITSGDYSAVFNPQVVAVKEGKQIIAQFLRETARSKPHIREIIVAGQEANWYKRHIANKNHKVKELPKSAKILTDMILLNDSVILSHYGSQDESAVKITQPLFYETMLTMFEELWERLG